MIGLKEFNWVFLPFVAWLSMLAWLEAGSLFGLFGAIFLIIMAGFMYSGVLND